MTGTPASTRYAGAWLALLLVAIACAVPYLPALSHAFVYDDHGSITENPFLQQPDAWVRTLTFGTFRDPHVLDGQRPMVILSYLADRALWGDAAWGFRLTNVLLHAGCAAAMAALFGRWTGRTALGCAAGLIAGLHPLATEAVQVPAFREDLLAALFVLLFLLFSNDWKNRWRALPMLGIALLAKETAVAAPLVLGWAWWCFPAMRPGRRQAIGFLATALALVGVYVLAAYTARPLQSVGGAWNGLALRFPANFATLPWLFVEWCRLLVVPWPLCADRVVVPVQSWGDLRWIAGVGLLAGVTALAWLSRRRLPAVAFAAGWLLLNFAPVSNAVPLFNPLADRYLYLPLAGFGLAVASLVALLPQRQTVMACLCAALAGLSHVRLKDWRDDETLWRATLRTEPRSARAQTWLGLIATGRGDLAEARVRYMAAISLNPQDVNPRVNLAVLDGRTGSPASAEKILREAAEIRPDRPEVWSNLAVALELQGRSAEAQQARERAASCDSYRAAANAAAMRPQS